ncbi:MAG: tail fiber domain-containing protein [Porticoccaceae bacterium]
MYPAHYRTKFLSYLLALSTLTVVPLPAAAQEAQPGDVCAAGEAGWYRRTSMTTQTNGGNMMLCDGANWQSFINFTSAGKLGVWNNTPNVELDVSGTGQMNALNLNGVTGLASPITAVPSFLDDLTDVSTTGVADGNVLLYSAGASGWVTGTASGGGGSPAGANTQVQFNSGGAFGASANVTYNGTTLTVTNSTTTNGTAALKGDATGASGNTRGVYGKSVSGQAVYGEVSATSGTNYGGYFWSKSPSGRGVFGVNTSTTGSAWGGFFQTSSSTGAAVYGIASSTGGMNYGVHGVSSSAIGYGGFFQNTAGGIAVLVSGDLRTSGGIGIGQSPDAGVELDVLGDIEYTGTITDMSDRRLKTDIANLPTGQLSKITALQGVSFKMKDDPDAGTELGFIAQDVQSLFPDLVYERNEGMLSLNYTGLIAPMVEAMKEQQVVINAQKKEIDELTKRIEALETKK